MLVERLADYKSETLKMSKQKRRRLVLILTLSISIATLMLGSSYAAREPQGASATASAARNAAIVATTAAVLTETSEIRQLPILREVKSGSQTRADIERMLTRNLDSQTTPAEMHATEVSLKKLGLVPSDFQFRPFFIKLLTEQVAAYYDTTARHFYLADWIELEGQKPVMAHELAHALQDQHFNLKRFEKWPKGDSDAELAAHALIEGDASLTMLQYLAKNPLVALAFIRSMQGANNSTEQLDKAPRVLRESLLFPYERGLEWATKLFRTGGWEKVSAAYRKLPLSSEQIIHPEKYFSYEVPLKISLPEVRGMLGNDWKKLQYDVNGEWSYYLILDQFLNTPADSKRAAAGWAGDRYVVYQGVDPRQVFMAQLSAWDTPEDARQFFDAYVKRTRLRYPNAKAETPVPPGSPTAEFLAWRTGEGGVVIELRGSRVLILEGIPDRVVQRTLVRAMWQ